ncbi:hypothetical protein B0W47_00620 [Komagataeibacter nataicola]|uniref:Uncharacterized protein n=1 Tax=Komagataeibacter nataicola TaxID=265960 RepID=A0A9N7H0J9_9PROT|nr:hypothetical protein [Komagataeibacter nataicola]AQU86205.1 hypothetical protein B0W47_00620 [Komagataeibacter nataicola]PYD65339.1 hypothetical protein CDI09_14125 [Komagataeibacter nataicola]WNM08391.1 hypothetical protein RI056_16260 [Komagataeibacter nataicola]GBR23066.1 hypothetical protein AA0616_2434 [Komagataeibacter nataicola NRIC 0616]
MNHVSKIRPGVVVAYRPAEPAIAALIDARRGGMAILPRDVTPDVASQARAQLAAARLAMQPSTPQMVMAWLKKLAGMVSNPPADEGAIRASVEAIVEVCGDLPAGVWSVSSRQAWCRQAAINGRLPGTFWPRPAELYALLRTIADRIAHEVEGCKAILAVADRAPDVPRSKPTLAERAAVAAKVAELQRERAEREAAEARISRFGGYMPGGDATLRGWPLVRALEAELPRMTGDLRAVTIERIADLRRAFQAADNLLAEAKNA